MSLLMWCVKLFTKPLCLISTTLGASWMHSEGFPELKKLFSWFSRPGIQHHILLHYSLANKSALGVVHDVHILAPVANRRVRRLMGPKLAASEDQIGFSPGDQNNVQS